MSNLSAPGLRSPWRWVTAAAAVTALASHLPVTEDHLEEAMYIGVLFIVLEVACAVLTVFLLLRDNRAVWLATSLTGAAAIAAFVLSRSLGLPEITDDVGNWTEPLAIVAVTAEAAMIVCGAAALRRRTSASPTQPRLAIPAGIACLVVGLGMTDAAASASSENSHPMGAHHSASSAAMPGMAMSEKGYWAGVSGGAFHYSGTTRTYYISADEVPWNYAPAGRNRITGKPFDDVANTYVKTGPDRIGSTYVKCLYRGYTDGTFSKRLKRAKSERYMGLLGPVVRAVVGDRVRIVFRNRCSIPDSIHMHGLKYDKASEGAPYNDRTSGAKKADDRVRPGHRYVYHYEVPARSGPAPGDGSSVMWMYHSHTNEISDTYAGLMGPVVVTAANMARPNGTPKDVDREVFALFSVMNENKSPYLEKNLKKYAKPPRTGDPDGDDDFNESNLMHSINGYVFGNMPMITMHKGQRVRWYVMSMGTEVDLHTPHWHGNTVEVNGMRMDTVSLLPAQMIVADMVPDDVGVWLFHCHVNDHITAGMLTRYQVLK